MCYLERCLEFLLTSYSSKNSNLKCHKALNMHSSSSQSHTMANIHLMGMNKAALDQAQEAVAEARKRDIVVERTRTTTPTLTGHSTSNQFSNTRQTGNRRCGDDNPFFDTNHQHFHPSRMDTKCSSALPP